MAKKESIKQIEVLPALRNIRIKENSNEFASFNKNYWNYYLKLEEEFLATEKYVEFHKDNYKAYSLEFLKLFQVVCSEIDVVGKAMASEIYSTQKIKFKSEDANIQKWWFPIQYNYMKKNSTYTLIDRSVTFNEIYMIEPWKGYEIEKCRITTNNGISSSVSREYMRLKQDETGKTIATTPSWWIAYNDVKHQRTTIIKGSSKINFSKANLWNLSNAFGALYILERSYLRMIGCDPDYTSIADSCLFAPTSKW